MKNKMSASMFQKEQVIESIRQSFVKLNPRMMIKNPIMFTVEVVTVIMLVVTLLSLFTPEYGTFGYNLCVFLILFVTLLFANFAEAIAEARGKAQADSLRKTREETPAKLVIGDKVQTVSSSKLKKGDVFVCEAGDTIPADGEIIEGLASIDESAITGESAPVIREAGGDKSSVTGGTKVLSDHIKVLVTQQPGESFLDKMIALVEGASRQKTPNEIALTILLAGFTLVFVIVCVTLIPFADYTSLEHPGTAISIAAILSLFVCLIPTTIGGLLSAIGIAGMDPVYAKNIGVDIDNLYISQPDNGEQALEITETMVRSGAVDIVIVDSVAALVPKAEIDGDMGDSHVGLQARLMSQALRKLTAVISKSNCVVIFINQLREKVGVMFGNPETTTGGRALKFYSSIRMDVRRVETLKQGGEMVGNHTRIKVVKNKVAPPFKQAEFDIMFGTGISKEGDILDLAAECGIVNKSGAWYAYNGDKIGQGRENAKIFLKEHTDICDEIEKQVRIHYHLLPDEEGQAKEPVPATGDAPDASEE